MPTAIVFDVLFSSHKFIKWELKKKSPLNWSEFAAFEYKRLALEEDEGSRGREVGGGGETESMYVEGDDDQRVERRGVGGERVWYLDEEEEEDDEQDIDHDEKKEEPIGFYSNLLYRVEESYKATLSQIWGGR